MELNGKKNNEIAFQNFDIDTKMKRINTMPVGRSDVFFFVDKYYGKIQCKIMIDSRQHAGIRTFILKCDSTLGSISCVEIPYSSNCRYFNYHQEIKIVPEFEGQTITIKLSILFADQTGYSDSWSI